MLIETSDSLIVLSTCVSPRLSTVARIFHFISLAGLIGLLIMFPFRQQLINTIEGGTERKLRAVLALNIAERILAIAISLTAVLWFLSPFFMPESYSSCLAPL